jgi:WD40 repeat protein/DNA-directed RNA polymerase specialized sigma24 family protein
MNQLPLNGYQDGLSPAPPDPETRLAFALQHADPHDPDLLPLLWQAGGGLLLRLSQALLNSPPGAQADALARRAARRAVQHVAEFWGQPSVGAWLLRQGLLASAGFRPDASPAADAPPPAPTPADSAEAALWQAVDRLPARQRQALILASLFALPEAEAAAALHTSPSRGGRLLAGAYRRLSPLEPDPARLAESLARRWPAPTPAEVSAAAPSWDEEPLPARPSLSLAWTGWRPYLSLAGLLSLALLVVFLAYGGLDFRPGQPEIFTPPAAPSVIPPLDLQSQQDPAIRPPTAAPGPLPTPYPAIPPAERQTRIYSGFPVLSADGSTLAFTSTAPFTGQTDEPDGLKIILYDLLSGEFNRVTSDRPDENGVLGLNLPALSGDGSRLAFNVLHGDPQLAPADLPCQVDIPSTVTSRTDLCAEIQVYDRRTGELRRIPPVEPGAVSLLPLLSPDGRWLVFWTTTTGPQDIRLDLALYDLEQDVLARRFPIGRRNLSELALGQVSLDAGAGLLALTLNPGDRLAQAPEGAPAGSLAQARILLYDRANDIFLPGPPGLDGAAPDGPVFSPALTPDGRWLAFASLADNLVPGDANQTADVFIWDRQQGSVELVSLASDSTQADGPSGARLDFRASPGAADYDAEPLAVSVDGRYVSFPSLATNLVPGLESCLPGRTPDWRQDCARIYLRDRLSGETTLVSPASQPGVNGPQPFPAAYAFYRPSLSFDGPRIAFEGRVSDCLPGVANIPRLDADGPLVCAEIWLLGGGETYQPRPLVQDYYSRCPGPGCPPEKAAEAAPPWLPYHELATLRLLEGASDSAGTASPPLTGGPLRALAISPDGSLLAAADFRAEGPRLVSTPIPGVAGSGPPDPYAQGRLRLWRTSDLQPAGELVYPQPVAGDAYALAFSPDGGWIASGHRDGGLRIWDLAEGELRFRLDSQAGPISSLAFTTTPDGRTWLAAGAESGLWVWRVRQEVNFLVDVLPYNYPEQRVSAVAFSPDGSLLASVGGDYTVYVHSFPDGALRFRLGGEPQTIQQLAFSPDGQYLAYGGGERAVYVWRLRPGGDGFPRPEFSARLEHAEVVRSLAFLPSSPLTRLALADHCPLSGPGCPGPGGMLLVTASTGQDGLSFWRLGDRSEPARLLFRRSQPEPARLLTLAFSPDGSLLAGGSSQGRVFLWQAVETVASPAYADRLVSDTVDTFPLAPAWTGLPGPDQYPLTLPQAAGRLPGLLAPSSLPEGLVFIGARQTVSPPGGVVLVYEYASLGQPMGRLNLTQALAPASLTNLAGELGYQLGASALVQRLRLGAWNGEFFAGDWVLDENLGRRVAHWHWRPDDPALHLRGRQGALLVFFDYLPDPATRSMPGDQHLTRLELLRLAQSLLPYNSD